MSENNREKEWRPIYKDGANAFRMGHSEDSNQYGRGQIMERCAWSAGFHDARREGEK